MQWIKAVWLIILAHASHQDIKDRKISILPAFIAATLICAGKIILKESHIGECFLGMVPGIFLLGVHKIAGKHVGNGDGMMLAVLGAVFGIQRALAWSFMGIGLCGIISIFLLVFKMADLKTSLPFIVFIFISFFIDIVN